MEKIQNTDLIVLPNCFLPLIVITTNDDCVHIVYPAATETDRDFVAGYLKDHKLTVDSSNVYVVRSVSEMFKLFYNTVITL